MTSQQVHMISIAKSFREFSNERTRVERRETFRKLRMRENFSKAFEGYFQWISKAGEDILEQTHNFWVSQIEDLCIDFFFQFIPVDIILTHP